MRDVKMLSKIGYVTLTAAIAVAAMVPGCGNGFLGLQDYQRDLLFGGALASALLNQQDGGAGQPIPGVDGVDCWDLNGNGQGDANEDINGDGAFDALDCQGAAGSPGRDGSNGTGSGEDGLDCWDTNGNGNRDADEDSNGDGVVDVLDCRGANGADGAAGSNGGAGAAGESFFDIFIDDFFGGNRTAQGDLPVLAVSVTEPALGIEGPRIAGIQSSDAIAYRVSVPERYGVGNDVTMRLFFYRTGNFERDCFVFTVDARRLRSGSGILEYGTRRWVRIDAGAAEGAAAGLGVDSDVLLVIDLPINAVSGLGLPNNLMGGEFLAFELATHQRDGRLHELLGVEFIESRSGTAAISGATVFSSDDDVKCDFLDCNQNGIPDDVDLARETSFDCDGNGVPDECASCPPLDIVFVMDTSGSMRDEGQALCDSIGAVVAELAGRGIMVNPDILSIAPNNAGDVPPCVDGLNDSVAATVGTLVPGDNGSCPADLNAPGDSQASEKDESWGPATAILAQNYPWTEGAIRVIVPVSDEGACLGNSCDDPGRDRDSVDNAIRVANENNVIVAPVAANGSGSCVINLMEDLASGTGGVVVQSNNASTDIPEAIDSIVTLLCRSAGDCNGDLIPDACQLCGGPGQSAAPVGCLDDCNGNLRPDVCEISQTSQAPGGPFFCTQNCDADENNNGRPDECDTECVCHDDIEVICEPGVISGSAASTGTTVFYDPPTVGPDCLFNCNDTASDGAAAGGSCEVTCDPPSGSVLLPGETIVTCTSQPNIPLEGNAAGIQPVDQCGFTINVLELPSVCVGPYVGSWELPSFATGSASAELMSDGSLVVTFFGIDQGRDYVMTGSVSACGDLSASNIQLGANMNGVMSASGGCSGSGSFSTSNVGSGTWSLDFSLN